MAELQKVVIDLGKGKKLELTPDEAKELKRILGELFGGEKVVTIPQPYPYPVTPYVYQGWNGPYYARRYDSTVGVYTITSNNGANHSGYSAQ